MNINQAYPSRYIAAEDLQGRSVTVTIQSVSLEELGQGHDKDTKLVLTFAGKAKALVCNKTNAKTIEKLYGPETDHWVGKPIIIAPREVEFQGNMVWAIRVSLQKPASSQPPAQPPVSGNQPAFPAPAGQGHADQPKHVERPQPGPDGQAFDNSGADQDVPF